MKELVRNYDERIGEELRYIPNNLKIDRLIIQFCRQRFIKCNNLHYYRYVITLIHKHLKTKLHLNSRIYSNKTNLLYQQLQFLVLPLL